jgi:hypothetical protein
VSLWTRLTDPQPGEAKIPNHQFMAGIAEFERGAVNQAQFATAFDLDAGEEAQLVTWYTGVYLVDPDIDRQVLHDVLLLAEGGQYTNAQAKTRLGM